MSAHGATAAERAAGQIRAALGPSSPTVALVLGSGLGVITDTFADARHLGYGSIEGFPATSVVGHAGRVVVGRLRGHDVLVFDGRVHQYDGHTAAAAAFPARVAHAMGARVLLLTNAAGGIRETLAPGHLMVIDDHINLSFRNPLVGAVEPGDERFPDMSAPYDRALTALLDRALAAAKAPGERGVYACVLGPSYETAAEIRMLARMGADAVGMSTVPEVIAGRALGLRVAGLSLITNRAAGLTPARLSHKEVLEAAEAARAHIAAVVETFVAGVASAG